MSVKASTYQLTFELDLPEEGSIAGLSVEEIQARKDVARAMIDSGKFFEKDEDGNPIFPFWFTSYLRYTEGGYPFRVAILMAWLGTPKSKRVPRTKKELADMLGLSSPRQFSVWMQRNPQIEVEANMAWKNRILDALNDSVDAMLEVAATPDYKSNKDRALHFKMAGELVERIELNNPNVDLSKLTYEEKLALAGLDDPKKLEQFRRDMQAKIPAQDMEGNDE